MSIVTTSRYSLASIVAVTKTDSRATVGAAASSFATCSLWTLPFAHNLALILPSRFSFRKISNVNAFDFSSSDSLSA